MPLQGYVHFLRANRAFLGFGFLLAFASTFGQTVYIGVYGPQIQSEFGLSHTEWGGVYMLGTLTSAFLLPFTGKQIDRFALAPFTIGVFLLLTFACVFISTTAGSLTLIVAIFLLRHGGQGLMSHTSITSMARYFDLERGRAIAIASLGFAAGESVMPYIAVISISIIGWRLSYLTSALVAAIVFAPIALMLLRRSGPSRQAAPIAHDLTDAERSSRRRDWSRGDVLRDLRFYLLLPGLFSNSMIITALFFHHLSLADVKSWTHTWVTGSYFLFAIITVIMLFVFGFLVDRFSAITMARFMYIPLTISTIIIATVDVPLGAWLYLTFIGINTGMHFVTTSAIWAELYGTRHLGAIKSLTAAIGVFASALGPVTLGVFMDRGIGIESGFLIFGAWAVLGGVSILAALWNTPPRRLAPEAG